MKHYSFNIILFILFCWLTISCANNPKNALSSGDTFYVSMDGDDNNSGVSEENAWKTIQKVNNYDFSPGDQILFRGGDSFNGTIILSSEDQGEEYRHLVVSSYGEGKATINGMENEGLIADSCHYLTIENLDFAGLGRTGGNEADGILVRNSNNAIVNEINTHGFQHSGLHLHRCNDARITNVYAYENGFAGIHVTGNTMRDPENYHNHNLYIGCCVAENNPGDPTVLDNHSGNGILASSVKGGTIEYCEAFNNGWDMQWTGNGPVGIWIWDCTDVTIQHCISHHNRTNPVAADGGGFDFDGGVSNSVIQYCISHNNEGAGYGLYEFGAAKPWENNIVRYNISQDDGIINGGSVGIWKNDERGVMRNCQIYNNTFINNNPDGSNIWLYNNYPGYEFRNNIFLYRGSFLFEGNKLKDEIFQGNLYWNMDGDKDFEGYENLREWAENTGREMMDDSFTGIYEDPVFLKNEKLSITNPSMIDRKTLEMYVPGKASPVVDRGLDLKELFKLDPGKYDLTGMEIPFGERYDLGAIEYKD